jgi:hypothetical protein
MRTCPPFRDELPFELDLPGGQTCRVQKRLDVFDAVRRGHAQFAGAVRERPRFVSEKLASTLKPPEHTTPVDEIDAVVRRV